MSAARHRAWAGRGFTFLAVIGVAGCGGAGKTQPPVAAREHEPAPAVAIRPDEAPVKDAPAAEAAKATPTTLPAMPDRPDVAAGNHSVESLAAEVARLKLELESQRRAPARAEADAPGEGKPAHAADAARQPAAAAAAKLDAPVIAHPQQEQVATTKAVAAAATAEPAAAPGAAGANAAMSVDDWAKVMEVEEKPQTGNAPRADNKAAAANPGAGGSTSPAEQRIKDNPLDVAAHLEYQLAKFLRNEPVPDLAAMAKLPQEDREILTALLDGLSNFRNGLRAEGNPLLSEKLRPLLDLAGRLRAQADLAIPTIALCTDVRSFGVYTPVEPARFESSRTGARGQNVGPRFVIYCEIQNLASRQSADGQWESQFAQQSVLYTEQGRVAWDGGRTVLTDRARNRRHDFHSVAKVLLRPGELPVGRYVLKVTIEDEISHRVAEATTPVDIVTRAAAAPVQASAREPMAPRAGTPAPPVPHGLIPFPQLIAPAPAGAAAPGVAAPSGR